MVSSFLCSDREGRPPGGPGLCGPLPGDRPTAPRRGGGSTERAFCSVDPPSWCGAGSGTGKGGAEARTRTAGAPPGLARRGSGRTTVRPGHPPATAPRVWDHRQSTSANPTESHSRVGGTADVLRRRTLVRQPRYDASDHPGRHARHAPRRDHDADPRKQKREKDPPAARGFHRRRCPRPPPARRNPAASIGPEQTTAARRKGPPRSGTRHSHLLELPLAGRKRPVRKPGKPARGRPGRGLGRTTAREQKRAAPAGTGAASPEGEASEPLPRRVTPPGPAGP